MNFLCEPGSVDILYVFLWSLGLFVIFECIQVLRKFFPRACEILFLS